MEIAALHSTRDAIDAGFANALDIALSALSAGGRIVISGIGKNLPIAEKFSATLSSTGSPSIVLNPVQALHGDLGMLSKSDVAVAMSFSGESGEVLHLLPHLKSRGIAIIAMTGNPSSTLAKSSNALLKISATAECDPFNLAPTSSTTATLALADAFAMALLDIRNFARDDYAKLHPEGAIGQTLLARATDVMRKGDKVATLPSSASVAEAIAAMTRAKAGAAYIVDAATHLMGIFTDGDLRRFITNAPANLACPLSEVMTSNPAFIRNDKMASDVLRLFRERQIDDIPVVDSDGRLVGAIDISDLPKLKVL